jgi:outer membrane protein OmpA-like peptidoglycan-associated protein
LPIWPKAGFVKARLVVLAVLVTSPAFAEHAASTEACERDATCYARSLAATLTAKPEVHEPARPAIEMRRFVDFAPGRVRVYSKSRAKVEALADRWKRHPGWATITVHGYAGAGDGVLAQRRADKIRGYLIRYGVPADLVVAEGHVSPSAAATAELSIELCADASACR